MIPLSELIEASLSEYQKGKSPHMIAWRQFFMVLMSFRRDLPDEAADLARQSLAMASNSDPRAVSNQLIPALIDLKQGRSGQARAALKKLRGKVDDWELKPFQVVDPDNTLWYNQGAMIVLLDEAVRIAADTGD